MRDTKITTYNLDVPRWLWNEFGAALEDDETYNDPLVEFVAEETLARRDGDLDDTTEERIRQFVETDGEAQATAERQSETAPETEVGYDV